MCGVYDLCNQDTVTSGNILPQPGLSDTLDLSEDYYNITYGLDDLISLFEVETDDESSSTSKRYLEIHIVISLPLKGASSKRLPSNI